MNIIDLHCDTIEHLTDNKDMELKKNNLAIDLEKLKRGNSLAQFFAYLLICMNNLKLLIELWICSIDFMKR